MVFNIGSQHAEQINNVAGDQWNQVTIDDDEARPPRSSERVDTEVSSQVDGGSDPGVFISYRRDDTQGYARALHDALVEQLGAVRIFRDVDAVRPGEDFVDSIERALREAAVMIVLIGAQWATVRKRDGVRRLDDPDDYVRLEIATALARGVMVIPVLVQGAPMPRADDLPDDLKRLARINALELSDSRWQFDLGTLVAAARSRVATAR